MALTGLAAPGAALAAERAVSSSWLDGYFNNTGIGDAGSDYADIDNLGSYLVRSEGAGVTPDTLQDLDDTGLTYSVSGGVPGDPDNVTASNQTIDTSYGLGSLAATPATAISFVGLASNGSKTASITLNYSDSSTQSISAQLSDWCDSDPQGTNVRVATWPQRWYNGSAQQLACGLWRTEVYELAPQTPGATLESITFGNQPNFHVFAIASDAVVDEDAITLTATGAPTITPTSAQYSNAGVTLTASGAPTWSETGVSNAYRWTVGGTAVPGATGTTYAVRPSDVGQEIKVVATGRKPGHVSGAAASNGVTVTPGTLVKATAPTVTGTPKVGSPLSATGGTYTPAASAITYTWLADGTPIPGATGASFTPGGSEVGAHISVIVTASLAGYGDLPTTLDVTGTVAKGTFTANSPATIQGTFAVGQTLTAAAASYSTPGVTSSYQWTADGAAIPGATSSTLVLGADQLDTTVGLKVTATKSGYDDLVSDVVGSKVAAGDVVVLASPTVTGDVVFGHAVTVTPGEYLPADATVSYAWLANNAVVPGAVGTSFVPGAAQVGAALQVRVTVSSPGYGDLVTTLSAGTVARESLTATKAPVISAATVGTPATVTSGSYSAAGVSVAYQWLVNGTPVKGATSARYTPVGNDLNKGVAVRVTATKAGYTTVTSTTAQVTVKAGSITVVKKPAIKGAKKAAKIKVGKKAKVSKGKYSVGGVKVKYQWFSGKKKITGKAGKKAAHKITKADRRKTLKVKVTVKKAGYKTVKVTTKKTVAVR